MSWCAEWIRDWLNKNKKSQASLSRLCGIGPDNISRWLNGQSRPDREAISRLVTNLQGAEAAELLVAWLKDCIPAGSDSLVRMEAVPPLAPNNTTLREDGALYRAQQQYFPPGMSADLRERLLFFGQLALDNPDIRKILDVCYQAAKRGSDD